MNTNTENLSFPDRFIAAGTDYTTRETFVPAPLFRKSFTVPAAGKKAFLTIGCGGFYELFFNGERMTKGFLSPFITNPDDILYYDRYDLTDRLVTGENVIGVCLGNGFYNNPFGNVWDFDKASFRGAPRFALSFHASLADGSEYCLESDETFVCNQSAILFDDYRAGEHYDARREHNGWNRPGYSDEKWSRAIMVPSPKGEKRLCIAEPIVTEKELKPISITENEEGYLFDFGENNSGVCRLTLEGTCGQKITLTYGERIRNGRLDNDNLLFDAWRPYRNLLHTDIYLCRGGMESYQPSFTYHGFRYVYVTGVTREQATEKLLSFIVFHTRLKERGGFRCSDPIADTIQDMTRRSTLSNFHHFPTDCPHREKNGWTGDARLSAVQTLLNLEPDRNYLEWLRSIVKAQAPNGALPGIVPTAGWGFSWGNGPAWDGVLTEIPYQLFRFRGDLTPAAECGEAIARYLAYLRTRIGENGLIAFGLGDWCQTGRKAWDPAAPLALTDTLVSMDSARKAAILFGALKQDKRREEAVSLYNVLRAAARRELIGPELTAKGNCQTSQAMGLAYGLFDESEKTTAFRYLLRLIEEKNGHMDVGVLGGRVLFDVLTDFGCVDLAYQMITRTDFPSYGEWAVKGETTLREMFTSEPEGSLNHHFWGDVSRFFVERIAGIVYCHKSFPGKAGIMPQFVGKLSFSEAWHESPDGIIRSRWAREKDGRILLLVEWPARRDGVIRLPVGYRFSEIGTNERPAARGRFLILKEG